ncbi:MAG: hypothetical protein AAFW89_09365 [Bacteroidota bacterium]
MMEEFVRLKVYGIAGYKNLVSKDKKGSDVILMNGLHEVISWWLERSTIVVCSGSMVHVGVPCVKMISNGPKR